MTFKCPLHKKIIFTIIPLFFMAGFQVLKSPVFSYLSLLGFLYVLYKTFEVYELTDATLIRRVFKNKIVITIDEKTHLKRIYGMAEKDLSDRSAMYFVSNGPEYIKLNKLSKNSKSQTIIDVLIDDYKLQIINKKDRLLLSRKVENYVESEKNGKG